MGKKVNVDNANWMKRSREKIPDVQKSKTEWVMLKKKQKIIAEQKLFAVNYEIDMLLEKKKKNQQN